MVFKNRDGKGRDNQKIILKNMIYQDKILTPFVNQEEPETPEEKEEEKEEKEEEGEESE